MLLILAGLLLMLAVALLAYVGPRRPRQTMRSRMDTTSIDMRRADDGLGDGKLDDPSTTPWGGG
jgi:hypothetical protein